MVPSPEGPQARLDQIVNKYEELLALLDSFGYALKVEEMYLDVCLKSGDFLFTLDELERAGY